MFNNKNDYNSSSPNNSLNALNSENKSILKVELNMMKKDLLFFKDDILKDIRKIEEKLSLKINQQNTLISDQYDDFQEKVETISNKIDHIDSMMINNSELIEKFNNLQSFKSKTENHIMSLNTKMNAFQKDYRDYFNNIDALINDNLRYPGVIGKNGRFRNFRNLIDYILNYFKEFNAFKEEIKNFDFNNFQKKINSNINDCRAAISDGYRTSLNLIEKNIKSFDSKLADVIKNNKKTMEEKFEGIKNKILENFTEYQKKISNIEKNIDDKYNEIENLKNKFIENMNNNIKSNFESNKNINESKIESYVQNILLKIINKSYIPEGQEIFKENLNNIKNNDKISDKILLEGNKESYLPLSFRTINDQPYINSKGRNNFIFKNILLKKNNNDKIDISQEKNINIINNFQNSDDEKDNTDKINILVNFSDKIMNKTQTNVKPRSLEKIYDTINLKNYIDENYDLRNPKERFSLSQDDITYKSGKINIFDSILKKPINKNHLNKYVNVKENDFLKSNYSVSNIPNIKIKKMVLPGFLTKRNTKMKIHNSSFSEDKRDKRVHILSNKQSSSTRCIPKEGKIKKNIFDVYKINKHKIDKIKSLNHSESLKIVNKIDDPKNNENLKSFMIMKIKQKTNDYNYLNNLKKRKAKENSFEIKKFEKDENFQIGLRKPSYDKNKYKELILMNSKNLSKIRKIKL